MSAAAATAPLTKKFSVKNISLLVSGIFGSVTIANSMALIPPDHIGVVRRYDGTIRKNHVFHSSEIALILPFIEHVVLIREKPVTKRFIKIYPCKDSSIEGRLTISIQTPVHWMPEILYKFGKDFGKSFLEREASIDFIEVLKNYNKQDLLNDDATLEIVRRELQLRLNDAASFHKLQISDIFITFVDPEQEGDSDEF
jgi:hypothetical protein